MWRQLSEPQKEVYDEHYFETTIRSLERYSRTSADLTPAIHTLIDAISRTFPLPRYTPVTKEEKLQTVIAEYMPQSVYNAIYN